MATAYIPLTRVIATLWLCQWTPLDPEYLREVAALSQEAPQ